MSRSPDQLVSEALALPHDDRARLIEALIASLDCEIEDSADTAARDAEAVERAWAIEVARRAGEIDAGRVRTRTGDEVFRVAREHLRTRRARRGG